MNPPLPPGRHGALALPATTLFASLLFLAGWNVLYLTGTWLIHRGFGVALIVVTVLYGVVSLPAIYIQAGLTIDMMGHLLLGRIAFSHYVALLGECLCVGVATWFRAIMWVPSLLCPLSLLVTIVLPELVTVVHYRAASDPNAVSTVDPFAVLVARVQAETIVAWLVLRRFTS